MALSASVSDRLTVGVACTVCVACTACARYVRCMHGVCRVFVSVLVCVQVFTSFEHESHMKRKDET